MHKRDDRPLGVAVRTYFTSPRHDDDWMEGWLELAAPGPGAGSAAAARGGRPLPGYGWVFGVGDGTCNVGLGILNSSRNSASWTTSRCCGNGLPACRRSGVLRRRTRWGRSAARPCPWASTAPRTIRPACCCWVMPAAWSVPLTARASPTRWNRPATPPNSSPSAAAANSLLARDHALSGYAGHLRHQWGSHFTLGRAFAQLIGKPQIMKLALRTGMPVPVLMRFVVRMLANLTDHGGRGFEDRVIHLLEKLAPATNNQPGPPPVPLSVSLAAPQPATAP